MHNNNYYILEENIYEIKKKKTKIKIKNLKS